MTRASRAIAPPVAWSFSG